MEEKNEKVIYIIFYSKRNKVTKVEESIFIPEKTKEEKKKWPLITALIVTLVILVVSTINWTNAFQITFFSDILEKVKILAEDNDRSLSQYINLVLKEHLKKDSIKKDRRKY